MVGCFGLEGRCDCSDGVATAKVQSSWRCRSDVLSQSDAVFTAPTYARKQSVVATVSLCAGDPCSVPRSDTDDGYDTQYIRDTTNNGNR